MQRCNGERAKGRRRPRRARRAAIDRGYLIDNFGRDALIPAASGSVKKKSSKSSINLARRDDRASVCFDSRWRCQMCPAGTLSRSGGRGGSAVPTMSFRGTGVPGE